MMKLGSSVKTALMATAMVVAASCVLIGCGKEEARVSVDDTVPETRMQDKGYRAELDRQKDEMKRAVVKRNDIGRELQKMYEAAKKKLHTEDEAKIDAYLARKPKWNELNEQLKAAEKAFEEERQKTLAVVRKRLNKKEPVSK